MKLDKLVGERFKERPNEAVIDSHALMLRGGYMKQVGGGIFSSYTALRRVTRKIEQIIREEMDAIGGQEVLFPVVMPASLWQESGRYESVGRELLRFRDRNDTPMLLGMTHEEAAVHLVREYGQTYAKYPFMIYQIQTKFRDEGRPRAGLLRVREFTMKDAYSFHTSAEDLEAYFDRCLHAYERIFARAGLPEVISVASDSGMMGGSTSCEFMLLSPIGEDSVVTCASCDYRANMEAAESVVVNDPGVEEELREVYTPDCKTIEDVCNYLKLPVKASCKAVVYQDAATEKYVVAFIRGDLEVNEAKLGKAAGGELYPAAITEESGIAAGFIGPHGLRNATYILDSSLAGIKSLCCGANKTDYHYVGLSIERDLPGAEFRDIANVTEGGLCPKCGKPSLALSRGIELGHIFQLGTKYTEAMGMRYTDENGESRYPLMGCYGIGVGRLAASVCEAKHDDYGPIWPISIAPWQVQLCCVRADDEAAKSLADGIYCKLQAEGVEVLYDDRSVSAGVMFSDADLLGAPIRVIVSPRNIKEGVCEVVTRDKSINRKVAADDVIQAVKDLIAELM
jgi:prolyl-tRNA synthetase